MWQPRLPHLQLHWVGALRHQQILQGFRGGCHICNSTGGWVSPSAAKKYKYLRAVYTGVGRVYAPFTFDELYFHQKLVARFTHPETVTHL